MAVIQQICLGDTSGPGGQIVESNCQSGATYNSPSAPLSSNVYVIHTSRAIASDEVSLDEGTFEINESITGVVITSTGRTGVTGTIAGETFSISW